MSESPSTPRISTESTHRRQVFWQVYFPLGFALLIFLAVSVIGAIASNNSAGTGKTWGSISLIWLILPTLLGGLVLLALGMGMIYLLARLLKATPIYSLRARTVVYQACAFIINLLNKIAAPVVNAHAWRASTRAVGQRLRPRRRA